MDNTTILSIVIIFIAFFVESTFGFGGGFISIPLLSLLLGVKNGVTFVLIFQFCMGFMLFKTYKDTKWNVVVPMTVTLILGTILGTYMLSLVSNMFLQKFLAITIFIFLLKMLLFQGFTFGKNPKKIWGLFTGLVGGWFQGITGTSSPIFTMYLTTLTPSKSSMRATLIYIFFATSVVRVMTSISSKLFNHQLLMLAIPSLPFFFLAIYLGHHMHKKLNEDYYRYTVYIILFFAAILLLIKK